MPSGISTENVVERIITILKRDLMLGNDIELAADTPLFNGDLDLDSLDALMLMQSMEKEFDFKIPAESFGPEVFKDVNSLAAAIGCPTHVEEVHQTSTASVDLDALPHRPPFRFITKVLTVKPGDSITGQWEVTGDEPFFEGHFPGHPIVPGVLITEALAQLSGLVGLADGRDQIDGHENTHPGGNGQSNIQDKSTVNGAIGKLAHVDMRFRESVIPPATIILQSRVERSLGMLVQFEVEAFVGEQRIVSGKLSLARTGSDSDSSP